MRGQEQWVSLKATPGSEFGAIEVAFNGWKVGNVPERYEARVLPLIQWLNSANYDMQVVVQPLSPDSVDLPARNASHVEVMTLRILAPSPERLELWLRATPEERAAIDLSTAREHRTNLKGQAKVQPALIALAKERGYWEGESTMSQSETQSGKYLGKSLLMFAVGNEEIGQVTAGFAVEDAPLFAAAQAGPIKIRTIVRKSQFSESYYACVYLTLP